MAWMTDVRRVERGFRAAADGDDAASSRELEGERNAGGLDVAVPGCVVTTFQSRTLSSRPSSARTRCTMVALASAGPPPVSWRSEVNGRPETRAPR